MPEEPPPPIAAASALGLAAAKVQSWLIQLNSGAQPLASADLRAYPPHEFSAGWRIQVEFPDRARRLDLLLAPDFPWKAPRIGLVDRPELLAWPHIEKNGLICLATNTIEINPDDPGGVAAHLLGDACGLVERLSRGDLDQDFRDEFLSYWSHAGGGGRTPIVSLVNPTGVSREVRLWRGRRLYVIAEDERSVERWLVGRDGAKPNGFRTEAAGLYFLPEAPLPRDYPASGQMLRSLVAVAGADAVAILDRLAGANPERLVSLFAASTVHGPALAAVIASAPAADRYGPRQPMTKGFRPGHVPPNVVRARYLGGAAVAGVPVERADSSWIHGRGQDQRIAVLNSKTVMVVGCGSIGAAVAVSLVQAGVGHVILVDPESLSWANVGRHPLGASAVGACKAKALADRLRKDFPHVVVEYHIANLDELIRMNPGALAQCDLVVSATGSWAAEARLDAWHADQGRARPIVYTWMEAHACAGHAVIVGAEGGGLRDGFGNTGVPLFQVTHWPNGATTRQEPACGAVYQPYGPIELGFINSLAAETCLNALLAVTHASDHRIWAAPEKRLMSMGGEWTPEWKELAGERVGGGCIVERPWVTPTQQTATDIAA